MANVISFQREPSPLELWMEYKQKRGLTDEMLAPLKGELLTIEQASKIVGTGIYGFKPSGAIGAYVFQIASGQYQARILYKEKAEDAPKVGESVKPRKAPKYYRPKGSANVLFIPPHITDWYGEEPYNLFIVEGALNAVRLAAEGYHAVAITGVYNYRLGNKHTKIIPELVTFAKAEQVERLTIFFDSDTDDPDVKRDLWNGINMLSMDLIGLRTDRRNSIYLLRPHALPDGNKAGPDDYLNLHGREEFDRLIREESQCYDDNPYLITERRAVELFIYDKSANQYFDTEQRIHCKTTHADAIMNILGKVEDITSTRPIKVLYDHKRLLAADGLRIAEGIRYQPDNDDLYFKDESEEPKRWFINSFQPQDLPTPIKGDVSIVYKVLESLCRDTPEAISKLLTIAAKHAQFPALTPKYGILFTGEQGSGKSNMARLIGTSLSKKYNSDRVNLNLDFNSTWRSCACKEWPEFDKDMDEEWLKDLITGESYLVSVKYGSNFKEKNHTLNIFTCNGLQAKLQHGDRRFLVCGDSKSDNKTLGLEFESWIKGPGPSFFRYHLLNEIDCSGYDVLDTWTKLKGDVIAASQSYRATVKDEILEMLEDVDGLECVPNTVLSFLLEPYKVSTISFIKEFGQYFVQPGQVKVKIEGKPQRFRAFKKLNKWKGETNTDAYRQQYELSIKLLKGQKF